MQKRRAFKRPPQHHQGKLPSSPMCWAQKELWSLCEYTAWEFSSLGSYRAETQVFLCHQNMQNTRCTAHLVIKDPCSNEQNAALQLQKQRILPVCTDAKSAELSILQDLVKNSTILGWRELVWTGSSILRHRFPGGGVGTPRGHSIITTLADLPYYSDCFEFPGFQTCLFRRPGKGQKYSEIAARQRMCGCVALVFSLFVGSERHNPLQFETRGGWFQGPGKLYSSNIFIKEPIWSKEAHTLTSTSSDMGLPS